MSAFLPNKKVSSSNGVSSSPFTIKRTFVYESDSDDGEWTTLENLNLMAALNRVNVPNCRPPDDCYGCDPVSDCKKALDLNEQGIINKKNHIDRLILENSSADAIQFARDELDHRIMMRKLSQSLFDEQKTIAVTKQWNLAQIKCCQQLIDHADSSDTITLAFYQTELERLMYKLSVSNTC